MSTARAKLVLSYIVLCCLNLCIYVEVLIKFGSNVTKPVLRLGYTVYSQGRTQGGAAGG